MTAKADAPSTYIKWHDIDWDIIETQVKQMQMRIAKGKMQKFY